MVIRWHLIILTRLITIEHVKGFGGLVHVTLGKLDLARVDSALQIDCDQIEFAPRIRV